MKRLRRVFLSEDCILGVLTGIAVYVGSVEVPELRAVHLFDLTAGISVAILAVVVAAFAILAAFLTDDYMIVIKEAFNDLRTAFEPYSVVAVVSGASTFLSGAGIFVWNVAPGWAQSALMAGAIGTAVWAVVGTVQLVGITANHGRIRMRVPEIRAAAREALEQREQEHRGEHQ